MDVGPERLTVKLDWHGRVLDGPLWRRVKAREALWLLDEGGRELQLLLPKDEQHYWKGLFQGGWVGAARGGLEGLGGGHGCWAWVGGTSQAGALVSRRPLRLTCTAPARAPAPRHRRRR